ncbi:alcohol dehydrogenase-like 2 isoform X2 [Beta vulgaris subsp. vulgaris]|uniref:alcohol dehydrogenase-like 2 isoform X2 n=1 Tax=Beta vulgaris subsp. vulgaris TaxID=3555 RepID=UPI0020370A90|nr:alcohol dehydrogenase-like 2 isoform X2 [Beta vulgaris subsp. vulgaris]
MENGKGNCTRETAGKPIICKAAVCRKAGEALIIEDIEVAPPQAWEVRIKILCTSLCHTDVSFWKIDSGPIANFPKIFGHEAVGIVESIGEHIEEVKEGDTVLPVFLADCGECRDCKSPKSNVCTKFENKKHSGMPRNKGYRFKDMKGEPIHHFFYVSSFAEYTVVDITHIVKIDPRMPVDKACLLSCGVTTGIGAVWKVAQVEEGSTVAIFGLGAVGLGAVQAAKLQGAAKIIGVDLNPEKEGIDPKSCGEKKISEAIKELTDGGADYCFECIGSATVMQDASESTRQGWGKTIILGAEVRGIPLSLNCLDIIQGKSVIGSIFGGIKPKSDIPVLTQKYMNEELCLDEYITHEVKLHDINKAFEYLVQGQSLRCIIWMDDSINHH